MKRLDGIRVLPGFLFGDANRLFDSWLWIFVGKLVSIFSSSLLIRILWNPSPLLLFLLLWSACDHARSALLPVACSRWIAGSTTQWWRFMRISESCLSLREFELCLMLMIEFNGEFAVFGMKLIWIGVEFDLGFVCSWAFLWICWIWSVTEWREKVKSVCWCGFRFWKFWHASPYIGCHVDSDPIGMWHVYWTWLAWPLGLTCNSKKRTFLQFMKIKSVLKELDWIAI